MAAAAGLDGGLLVAGDDVGRVVVGIAIVPARRRIWYAVRGQGAFSADVEDGQLVRERPLRVGGSPSTLAECTVGVLPPLEMIPVKYRAQVDRLTDQTVVADNPTRLLEPPSSPAARTHGWPLAPYSTTESR
jgi:hypothetical protein